MKRLLIVLGVIVLSACANMPSAPTTITATAQGAKNLSTLTKAVTEAGLADTLAGPGPFTVFAPSDEAFAKLPAGRLDALLKDKEQLRAVLTFHVIPGKVMAADVTNTRIKTVNGAEASVSRSGDMVGFEDGLVVQANVAATNGVIHVIDTVAIPPRR
jgi:uncharacterized surface protein with fasciclin (FAS1) repeats